MNKIPSFPKIYALGKKEVEAIFANSVEITEKVDGSHFFFGLINNNLHISSKEIILSRNKYYELLVRAYDSIMRLFKKNHRDIYEQHIDKMFKLPYKYVKQLHKNKKLPNNMIFYCEYMRAPKHVSLAYERIPKNNLALFGVRIIDRQKKSFFISKHSELDKKYAPLINIEAVPLLFSGKINDLAQLDEIIKAKSFLGDVDIEGIVIKNYAISTSALCAKYVAAKFKEKRELRTTPADKKEIRLNDFKGTFRTEARWEKGVQHLREKGELKNCPRDIGVILKEINHDIEKEEEDTIKDFLYNMYKGDILKSATNGFAQWYKEQLAAKQKFD